MSFNNMINGLKRALRLLLASWSATLVKKMGCGSTAVCFR